MNIDKNLSYQSSVFPANVNPFAPSIDSGRRKSETSKEDKVRLSTVLNNGQQDRIKRQIPNEKQNQNDPAPSNKFTINQQATNSGETVQGSSVGGNENNPTNNNGGNTSKNVNSSSNTINQNRSNPGFSRNFCNP